MPPHRGEDVAEDLLMKAAGEAAAEEPLARDALLSISSWSVPKSAPMHLCGHERRERPSPPLPLAPSATPGDQPSLRSSWCPLFDVSRGAAPAAAACASAAQLGSPR
eukprot:CAMPEP_0184389946 /NCGR_PEP_ID=MMETSP0007-20130409/12930_1 /TAXON_ID=97485 /ORGANISM="Prymnesium parvum, Strain Texoma1" /LENGTH=106 /DNA_ID=CAMNT_0026739499 /DNA_START=210 /DNA_END=528 /DNA_ORIENTATION=-